MGVMEVLTALLTITAPIIGTLVPTIVLSNRQTQRIIQNSNLQTQCILRKLKRCLVKISRTREEMVRTQREIKKLQEDMACTLKKVREFQADTTCLLKKVDLGLQANALMHGWRREDNITPRQAKRIPEPKVYDPKLKACYYLAS